MPRVGLESTTPMFERAKIVYALDRAATVMNNLPELLSINQILSFEAV
jgi:hypothetical protein